MDTNSLENFTTGLVFGFDLGTASIGYAVRRKAEFEETVSLICPTEDNINGLEDRNKARRQRRTIDSRGDRRGWLRKRLANLGFGPPDKVKYKKPEGEAGAFLKWEEDHHPSLLRAKALRGGKLEAWQLHVALVHAAGKRGYLKDVPWARQETNSKKAEKEQEEKGKLEKRMAETANELTALGFEFPSQLQEKIVRENLLPGAIPKKTQGRVWPREMVIQEYRTILEKQAAHYPEKLTPAVINELCFADNDPWPSEAEPRHFMFWRSRRKRGDQRTYPDVAAPFAMRWPRFDNRGPSLDVASPEGADGKPLHVMRRDMDDPDYREWQALIALLHFRVETPPPNANRKWPLRAPTGAEMIELLDLYRSQGRLSAEDLHLWAASHAGKIRIKKGQTDLIPEKKQGRASFSRPTLRGMLAKFREYAGGNGLDAFFGKVSEERLKIEKRNLKRGITKDDEKDSKALLRALSPNYQPVFKFKHESPDEAVRRFIGEIKDPVVKHRLELFDRLLVRLSTSKDKGGHGMPDHVVIESTKSLSLSKDDKDRQIASQQKNAGEKQEAAALLRDLGQEVSEDSIQKVRLLAECRWVCPYTLTSFLVSEFSELETSRMVPPGAAERGKFVQEVKDVLASSGIEIEHMVPRSVVVCNEFHNLTVTRKAINKQKGNSVPAVAFEKGYTAPDPQNNRTWEQLRVNAAKCFGEGSLKYRIFTEATAADLLDPKVNIQRTGYFTRCARQVVLTRFGWLAKDGRDPTTEENNAASLRCHFVSGKVTAFLRRAWEMNELLYPKMPKEEWEKLSQAQKDKEREDKQRKNRSDHRHHALDAMVLACCDPYEAVYLAAAEHKRGWVEEPNDGRLVPSVRCPIFGLEDHGEKFRDAAKIILEEMKQALPGAKHTEPGGKSRVDHYAGKARHKAVFTTTIYGVRNPAGEKKMENGSVFVTRKRLIELSVESLDVKCGGDVVFSEFLRKHIAAEWEKWSGDAENKKAVLANEQEYWQQQAEEAKKQDTKEKRQKKAAVAAKWQKSPPNWETILKFRDKQRNNAQGYGKALFPEEFVRTLFHPVWKQPLVSVKVRDQSGETGQFFGLPPNEENQVAGEHAGFLKYMEYDHMAVFGRENIKGGVEYGCELQRRWHPGKKWPGLKQHPHKEGWTYVGVFRKGQTLRVVAEDMPVNWYVSEFSKADLKGLEGSGLLGASIGIRLAHMAGNAARPGKDEEAEPAADEKPGTAKEGNESQAGEATGGEAGNTPVASEAVEEKKKKPRSRPQRISLDNFMAALDAESVVSPAARLLLEQTRIEKLRAKRAAEQRTLSKGKKGKTTAHEAAVKDER